MKDKKRYYKLDEIGFVGTQSKETGVKKSQTAKKTGEIFRAARKAAATKARRKAL